MREEGVGYRLHVEGGTRRLETLDARSLGRKGAFAAFGAFGGVYYSSGLIAKVHKQKKCAFGGPCGGICRPKRQLGTP